MSVCFVHVNFHGLSKAVTIFKRKGGFLDAEIVFVF